MQLLLSELSNLFWPKVGLDIFEVMWSLNQISLTHIGSKDGIKKNIAI